MAGDFITELPIDRERVAGAPNFATCEVPIDPRALGALRAIADAEGTTLPVVLGVAWSIVLARCAFTDDVVVGVRARTDATIRPLRVALSHATTFRPLVAHARDAAGRGLDGVSFRTAVVEGAPEGDLDVVVVPAERDSLRMQYDARLFDEDTIRGVGRSLATAIAALAADPDRPVYRAPLLDASDTAAMIALSSGPSVEYAYERIDALVRRTAADDPNAVALRHQGRSFTFGEIVARANALAHVLQRRVPRKGSSIGLLFERSPEFVVSQLAVWTAGHVCVPMDAGVPLARAKRMLDEARAELVICAPDLASSIEGVGCPRVSFDAVAEELAREPKTPPPSESRPQDLAYIIFTSGSTGVPKGVALHHGGLTNLMHMSLHLGSGRGEKHCHLSPLAFDVSIQGIWGTLVRGATIAFVPDALLVSPQDFMKWVIAEEITNLPLPSSLFEALADEDWTKTKVKRVGTGIEKLHKLDKKFPFVLIHSYGTTETTVGITRMVVKSLPPPIGRPYINARIYLLDSAMNLVPRGALGECYIAGPQVGRGYLRAETTAERFLPDPFGPPGARMYRTGDVMRWCTDGNLDFRGRADRQIKSRGFRIEPGEIESALRDEPEVREALVVALGERSDRIVAYAVTKTKTTTADLTAKLLPRLAKKLPSYMVPSLVIALESFPLNSNGKIDRNALPRPAVEGDASDAPVGHLETELANAFRAVLGVSQVGRTDDFFDLGGHSMLVVRLVSLVRARLGVEIPGGLLFEARTVEALAKRIEQLDRGATRPPLTPARDRRRAPLSWNQLTFWRRQERRPKSPGLGEIEAFRLAGALDQDALAKAFDVAFARHDVLRTRFAIEGGEPVQRFADPAPGVLTRVDMNGAPVEEVHAFLRAQHDAPPAMIDAPMIRPFLVRRAADEHWVVFNVHRTVLDTLLCATLLQEILAIYDGRGPTEAPEAQYADFVAWQRQIVSSPDARARIERARARLAGAPPVPLPFDRPSPPAYTDEVHAFRVPIEDETWRALRELARAESTAPFVVLAALYNSFLASCIGQDDITVIAPNELMRELDPRLVGVLGCFHDYFLLRTNVDRKETLRHLVRREHRIVIEAQQNIDIPCALVTDEYVDGPLWRVVLNVVPSVAAKKMVSSLDVSYLGYPAGKRHRMIDLAWGVVGDVGMLVGAADKFDAATVQRMARQLGAFVRRAVAAPDAPLADGAAADA